MTLNAEWEEEVVEEGFNVHITFSHLEQKGTEITSVDTLLTDLRAGEQKTNPADPSNIVSVTSLSKVFDGNASSGTFPNTAGLIKFGSSSSSGSFTFTVAKNVNTVKVLAAGWTASEGSVVVNGGTSQSVGTTKTWLTFPLSEATNSITIGTSTNRAFLFEIELIGGPVIPDPELDNIVVSSASGVASVEEKQELQLNAVVYDVEGDVVNNANVTWSSLNEEIATISGTGLVTAIATGNVMIKVEAVRGESLTSVQYALEVTARPAAFPAKVEIVGYTGANPSISIPLANGSVNLSAKVFNQYDEEMNDVTLVWESSNPGVATVNGGNIELKSLGDTTIKVSVDGFPAIFKKLVLTVSDVAPIREGFEGFEGTTNLTASYATNSFTRTDGIKFSYVQSRNEDDYGIDGKGLMFAGKTDAYVEFTLSEGLSKLEFDYRKAFIGSGNRQIKVIIDGLTVAQTDTWDNNNTYHFLYELPTASTGKVVVRIQQSLAKQATIDNIKWTY